MLILLYFSSINYCTMQTHTMYESVLNVWHSTPWHSCRGNTQTLFDGLSEPQLLFPIQLLVLKRISAHQSEMFGLWKLTLLLLFNLCLSLGPCEYLRCHSLRPPTTTATTLQRHSHSFLMFPMFGLPLRWLMRRHVAVVSYRIWAKCWGQRGNQNHFLKLSSPVWQSIRFAQATDRDKLQCFYCLKRKQSLVSIELQCFAVHKLQCVFLISGYFF